MRNLKGSADHLAAVLAKEMALVTGWNRERLAMLQARIHSIINSELAPFIEAESKAAEEAK